MLGIFFPEGKLTTCDPKMRISPSKTLCRLEELSGLQTLLDSKETGERTRA